MADSLEGVSKRVEVWVCDHGHAMAHPAPAVGASLCGHHLPPQYANGGTMGVIYLCGRQAWATRLRHPAARAALLLGGAQAAYDLERQLDAEVR